MWRGVCLLQTASCPLIGQLLAILASDWPELSSPPHDSRSDPSVSINLSQLKPMKEEKSVGGTNWDNENSHVLNSKRGSSLSGIIYWNSKYKSFHENIYVNCTNINYSWIKMMELASPSISDNYPPIVWRDENLSQPSTLFDKLIQWRYLISDYWTLHDWDVTQKIRETRKSRKKEMYLHFMRKSYNGRDIF